MVLNVFTTWCGPCKVEFPEMEAAYEKDHAGYEIVAVADDKVTVEDVAAYQPSEEEADAVSPSDVRFSVLKAEFSRHKLNYILDAVVILCLAFVSLLVFKRSRNY